MKRLIAALMLFIILLTSFSFAEEAVMNTASYMGQFTCKVDAEYIDMGKVRVLDMTKFIEFLHKLPNLKKVDMFNTNMYTKDIDKLAAAFPDIEFGWTMRIGDHWVRTDATAFSTLHNNRSPQHTERNFANLKVLILACQIELRDITPIGSLKNLEYLELFKNDIHDISCLKNCTNLIDLNLCFNRIKDWTPLLGLKKLERLWLFNSNNWSDEYPVDKQVVYDLKAALPDCHVDEKSYSTLGGWREHERYYVIYHMFKHGEYIPFDRGAEIKALYPNGINLNGPGY